MNNIEYKQFVSEHGTQKGILKITTTLKVVNGVNSLDDVSVSLNGKDLDIPRAWKKQTSSTIVRKVCAMLS